MWPAYRVPARNDGHPGVQREQQLRLWRHCALHGQAVRRGRPGGLRLGRGLREDGARLAGSQVHGSHQPAGPARDAHARVAGAVVGARGSVPVRERGRGAHGPVRDHQGAAGQDRPQEPQAQRQQPVLAVPRRVLAGADPGGAARQRTVDQAAVLPHVGRRRGGGGGVGGVRAAPRAGGSGGGDRGHGHGHGRGVHVQEAVADGHRGLRHDAPGRVPRARAGGPDAVGRAGDRAARLLQRQRADHVRGAGPVRRGRRRGAGGRRADLVRRQVRGEPVRRPDQQGPPARRHGAGAVRRAVLAAPRRGRRAPGRRRARRALAQPGARRRRRGDRVSAP
mmetsp:Transcript_30504/g.99610  ORF Transcript_30504/g.99610 Transcript_30504/m.99610 type:complete len:336 (+) Transcript_30504:230-1237(+)